MKKTNTHGGARDGAGRKKIDGGIRRMWTVPPDIDTIVQEHGTQWLWNTIRNAIREDA